MYEAHSWHRDVSKEQVFLNINFITLYQVHKNYPALMISIYLAPGLMGVHTSETRDM